MSNMMGQVVDNIQKMLSEHGLHLEYEFWFPQYAMMIPDECRLAIKILSKHKMRIRFVLKKNPTAPRKPDKK